IRQAGGSFELKKLAGLYRSAPLLAFRFLIPAHSLAGLPPLSGFWAQLLVVDSSLRAGEIALAPTALIVGLLTLYSMVKIWNEAFWKAPPTGSGEVQLAWRGSRRMRTAMLLP